MQVEVVVDDHISLRVIDDGIGPPAPSPVTSRGHGLRNMGARATRRGGDFDLAPGTDVGTVVRWQVPRG